MSKQDATIILALARNGMCIARACKDIFYARNTVCYHIGKIKKQTGLDPLNFYDLIELVSIARTIIPEDLDEERTNKD